MTHGGWLCALAWACLPLHAVAQAGAMGEAVTPGARQALVAPPDGGPLPPPAFPAQGLFPDIAEPGADPGAMPTMGGGLKPQGTQPAHWPDDLTLPPGRPDPVGLRPNPEALPGPTSGLASWYADHFHGRRTASGEPYSRYEMTAAHRDLPLGTLLHVSNPETGVGVVVRVNDRGPFHGNRVLDVSRAAASVLGLEQAGVGRVDIRLPSSEEAAEFAHRLADAAKWPVLPPLARKVAARPAKSKSSVNAKLTKPPLLKRAK